MIKPYPALCSACKHHVSDENSTWNLRCVNAKVNGNDPWALASSVPGKGTDCRGEREKTSWFSLCGRSGKLWEPMP